MINHENTYVQIYYPLQGWQANQWSEWTQNCILDAVLNNLSDNTLPILDIDITAVVYK